MPRGVEFSIGLGISQGNRQQPPQEQLVLWRQAQRTEHASGARLSLSLLVAITEVRLVSQIRDHGQTCIQRAQRVLDDGQLADATTNSLAALMTHVL